MHSKLSRRARLRALALVVPAAALAVVVGSSSLAGAAGPVAETGVTDQIKIELAGGNLKFVAPATVGYGDQLEIVNETNPKQVGPHTFSLVTKGSLPKTAKQRKTCFTPGKICMGIAGWYGLKGEENPKNPIVEVGAEGWDTMGTATKKGDSYFFGKKGASIEQVVSAKAGTTLYFMCAVHAFMQGSVKVLPPVTN